MVQYDTPDVLCRCVSPVNCVNMKSATSAQEILSLSVLSLAQSRTGTRQCAFLRTCRLATDPLKFPSSKFVGHLRQARVLRTACPKTTCYGSSSSKALPLCGSKGAEKCSCTIIHSPFVLR